jgi:hypothetical protein
VNSCRVDQVTAARSALGDMADREQHHRVPRTSRSSAAAGWAPQAVGVGLQMREDSPAELVGSDGTVSS